VWKQKSASFHVSINSMLANSVFHVYDYGMSDTILDVIQIAEKEIRRDADDLTRLKQRYPGYDFVRVDQSESAPARITPRPEPSRVQTAILGVIESSSFREWTSRSVLTELTASGQVGFPTDEAGMNAVGLALIAMAEAGRITRTHQGRGRDPHRYTANVEVKYQEPAVAGS
jgi:hypothetical protein